MPTRLATFRTGGRTSYGLIRDDGAIDLSKRLGAKYPALLDIIRGGPSALAEARAAGGKPDYTLDEIEYVPPLPGAEKILCVGINYPERAEEYKGALAKPKYPNLFIRFQDSFVGHNGHLVRPKVSEKFDYEGEIVVVIGKQGRHATPESAKSMIFGLTLGNEGSVRDWMRHGTSNITQGKNFDASGSMGPWIVPADEVDPFQKLRVTTRINGQVRQDDTTDRLSWSFAELISYISTFTTLRPGDMIFSGTPVGAGGHQDPPKWLVPGDTFEVEVPQIGTLRNTVVDET